MRSALSSLAIAAIALFCASARSETIKIESPNGNTVVTVNAGETSTYSATFDGATVLRESKLGQTFAGLELGKLERVESTTRKIDETWSQPLGPRSRYVDRGAETTVEFFWEKGAKSALVFRVYDDGFAFRYVVPEGVDATELQIDSEETEFAFGEDLDVWATFYPNYNTSQEKEYPKKKLSDIKPDSFIGSPLIVRGEGFIASLTESDLLDWSGSQFATAEDSASTVKIRLTPRADGRGAVVCEPGAQSPWRVVALGKQPIDLVNNSGIVLNCATPCALDDVSWIEPGNASWNWWAPKRNNLSNEFLKEMIDFSAEMGWRYALVDAGWSKTKKYGESAEAAITYRPEVNIPEAVEYGKQKNVRVLIWFHNKDVKAAGVRETLKRCAEWGVAGVKIDFMDSHNQEMVQWIKEVTEVAAEYKLLVDFHGMYKPTGLERTYPNQITREGIYGNEQNRWARITATHSATLPFTRCAIGPADYTPGGFLNEHSDSFKSLNDIKDPDATCRVIGTRARELALCLIYDSPLRCLCDLPKNYRGQAGLEFLRDLPCVWDETTALDGAIGEFYVVAKRSRNDFYVSGIANEEARDFSVKLDFLGEGEYEGTLYSDAPESDRDANVISIATKTYRRGDVLDVKAVRDGGWNLVLKKK
ncbi:MAG: glycoside hydrolase family 97 protein [Thermoguttaceae bacterium]|nr:glycoside hydrolase family 97 protein [Thermoguttaceae bacterium]